MTVALTQRSQSIPLLQRAYLPTVLLAMNLSALRDSYTAAHQRRVGHLAEAIALEMGLDSLRAHGILVAGFLHDLGKIKIPAEILVKPAPLSDLEYLFVKQHVQVGYDVLKSIEFPWPVADMVYQHHERLDGSGYPRQLKGDEILLDSHALIVADVVESISSHRPYRPAHGIDAALVEIERGSGTLFDPAAVAACLRLFREKQYSIPE